MVNLNPLAWFRREREPQRVEQKASAAGPAISSWTVGRPVWSERNYESFAKEAYLVNAIAHRCVKIIAQNAACPSWLLYGRNNEEIEEHPLLDLLRRPAPMIGGSALFEAFYAYLMISGNSYLEAAGPKRGAPNELWNLRPDRMQVIPGPYGAPQGYRYEVLGRQIDWQVDPIKGTGPILHVKEFHPLNDWYGLSPVEPAAYGVDRHNAASAHNKALLDNGARPSGALIFQPVSAGSGEPAANAPEAVLKQAEERLQSRHGGPKNAGRPMVFGGNVKWEEMGLSPKDMDFSKSKDDAARDICTAFGVPHILIVPGEATYNNVREANLMLWESAVLPVINKTLDALNAWLVPQFGDGLRLAVDLDEVPALEPRRELKRASVIALYDKGLISRDEGRDALQYDDWPDNEVAKPDASVITALADNVEQLGFEPVLRYLKSVGLYDPDVTAEEIGNQTIPPFDMQEEALGPVPQDNAEESDATDV